MLCHMSLERISILQFGALAGTWAVDRSPRPCTESHVLKEIRSVPTQVMIKRDFWPSALCRPGPCAAGTRHECLWTDRFSSATPATRGHGKGRGSLEASRRTRRASPRPWAPLAPAPAAAPASPRPGPTLNDHPATGEAWSSEIFLRSQL